MDVYAYMYLDILNLLRYYEDIFYLVATNLGIFSSYLLKKHFIMHSICKVDMCKVNKTHSTVDT